MKTVSVITTWPQTGRFDYSILVSSQPWREGVQAAYVLGDLSEPQRAVLAAAEAVLLGIAENQGPALDPGQSWQITATKPASNQIECAVMAGSVLVRHGVLIGYDPVALSGPDRDDLLAARALLAELATADATAQGLL